MSIAVMDRVWRHSKARQGDLLVMLAIADFANDDGEAWPSVGTLAKKSRLSEREIQYALRRMEQSGELGTLPNKGPRGCNLYKIVVVECEVEGVQKLQGANIAPVQFATPRGCSTLHPNRHTEPSSNILLMILKSHQMVRVVSIAFGKLTLERLGS